MSGLELLLVAIGGALGALARSVADQAAARAGWNAESGTFVINLTGSLLAGLLITLIVERTFVPAEMRPFLITGVLGGFTTFSALSLQLARLIAAGDAFHAVAYAAGSVVLGVVGALLGVALGRLV